jgi:diguanylate cyclase (GGDEF)-like protein
MNLSISRKLLLGYLCMTLLTVLSSAYAVINLQKLKFLAGDIANRNFETVETAKSLLDKLLAQENAEKKYLILKDQKLAQIYWLRNTEFKASLDKLKKLNVGQRDEVIFQNLTALSDQYSSYFSQEENLIKEKRFKDARAVSDSDSKAIIDQIAGQLKVVQVNAEKAITDKMGIITSQSSNAAFMTLGLGLLSLVLGITLALVITGHISKPLRQLQKATGFIAEGKLDYEIKIDRHDEIGALAKSFSYMTKRLKILEEINLDASPLTGLPGNLAIENQIKKLLAGRKMFSLCQVDLDNFKPFADKYGYAWGSEIIKEVADILNGYITEKATNEIFIGHIGGDDFVVIADPAKAKNICQKLVADFEKRILNFYNSEDAKSRFIMGKDRRGVIHKFPLITVSVAIVTDNGSRFSNPLDMAMTVAELKEYAKLLPGSNYVTEDDLEKYNILDPQEKNNRLELKS